MGKYENPNKGKSSSGMKLIISSISPYILLFVVILATSIAIAIGVIKLFPFLFAGLSDGEMSLAAGIIQSCAAIISICVLVYQLRQGVKLNEQQRNIDEARFVLQYNRVFIEDENMAYVERQLEAYARKDKQGNELLTNDNRQYFINYLVYFEGLALSILRGEIGLDRIDDLMGYRFFLIMNNEVVVKEEIKAFPDYYRGCVALYKIWENYRIEMKKPIPQGEHSLEKMWNEYPSFVEKYFRNNNEWNYT